MRQVLEISRTALTSILLYPLRSVATVAAVVTALLPYLVGLGISRGIQDEAETAVHFGADLYVSAEQLGRTVPVPLAAVAELRRMPGVEEVRPRIVGRIELGKDRVSAVLVGVSLDQLPALECIDGRLPRATSPEATLTGPHELLVGSDLARRLGLRVGSHIPPFYRNRQGERVSQVIGVFRSDVSLWQARLIVTSFADAAHIFDQPDLATDLLIRCRPGYQATVRDAIRRHATLLDPAGMLRPRVVGRDELAVLVPQALLRREGVFTALFAMAFAMAILTILVTSGFGTADRRREIGILKALGWQTDELLLRSFVESALLALIGSATAVLLALLWLKACNGYWIASIFLAGVDATPGFQVPFRLLPLPVVLAFAVALVVVLTGSLYATWRTATAPPREVMR
jgi:ABC-type lipoprotein release transport system permease subunit